MALPPQVTPLDGGGYEVQVRRGWRGLSIAIGVGGVVLGLGLIGVGLGLRALGVDTGQLPLVGVLFVVVTPLIAARDLRSQRDETWRLDRDGLRAGGRTVAWERVSSIHLRDRHTRLPSGGGRGPGPWVRLVSVTARDRDGEVVLRLPDENHDDRLRTVFALAHAQGLVPAHVRFEEHRE